MVCCVQWIQIQLWERHRLRTLRRTMADIAATGRLAEDGTLSLQQQDTGRGGTTAIPVSVFYFRQVRAALVRRWVTGYHRLLTHTPACPQVCLHTQ